MCLVFIGVEIMPLYLVKFHFCQQVFDELDEFLALAYLGMLIGIGEHVESFVV